jgi:hypothetical protein
MPFVRQDNPYRHGGVRIARADVHARLHREENSVDVRRD